VNPGNVPFPTQGVDASTNIDILIAMTTATQLDMAATARRFQALSDPTRLRILELLAGGERCVCELTAATGAAQSRLSFHLKALRQAGLLRARRSGRWMYYSVDSEGVAGGASYLENLSERTVKQAPIDHVCAEDGSCCG
jgi:ArsR family transcriptional regulator